jgi:hypothetical protein
MENFLQLLSSSSDHCTVSRENRSPTRLANKVKKCQKFKFEQKNSNIVSVWISVVLLVSKFPIFWSKNDTAAIVGIVQLELV